MKNIMHHTALARSLQYIINTISTTLSLCKQARLEMNFATNMIYFMTSYNSNQS